MPNKSISSSLLVVTLSFSSVSSFSRPNHPKRFMMFCQGKYNFVKSIFIALKRVHNL